jgi:hypothetical protein
MKTSLEAEKIVHEIRSRLAEIATANTRILCDLSYGPTWLKGRISDDTVCTWADSEDLWWRRAASSATLP